LRGLTGDRSAEAAGRAGSVGKVSQLNPLGAAWRGGVAGAIGTVAMDVLWFSRYKRGGGTGSFGGWEFSSGSSGWEDAPAPAQMGRRVIEGVFQRQVPAERAGVVNDVMHWSYGFFWGVGYGMVAGSLAAPPMLRSGIAFGSLVWAGDYVVLPLAEVYKPIWEYDAKTLSKDLSAHLLYGVVAAIAFRLLRPGNGC
jgi:hypothetical protein